MDSGSKQTREQLLRVRRGPFKAFCNLPSWTRWTAVVFLAFWFLNLIFGLIVDEPTRGSFGDTFGAVNSFFSGAALLGIAYGVWIQRSQLLQAEAEIKDQNKNIERQHKAEDKRMFEATFFQLLTALNDIRKNISFTEYVDINELQDDDFVEALDSKEQQAKGIYNGQDAFRHFYSLITNNLNYDNCKRTEVDGVEFSKEEMEFQLLQRTYFSAYTEYGYAFSQYFRTLFTVLDFIDRSNLGEDEWFYAKLIRAQITNIEATILAFNFLSPYTTVKFNSLITKYGMLKNANTQYYLLKPLQKIDPAAMGRTYVKAKIDSEKAEQEIEESIKRRFNRTNT